MANLFEKENSSEDSSEEIIEDLEEIAEWLEDNFNPVLAEQILERQFYKRKLCELSKLPPSKKK